MDGRRRSVYCSVTPEAEPWSCTPRAPPACPTPSSSSALARRCPKPNSSPGPRPPGPLQVPGRRLVRRVPGPHSLRQAAETCPPRQPELGYRPV